MAALFLGLVGTLSAQNNDNLRGRINDRPNQAVQRRPNAPQKTDQRMPDRISDCQRDGLHGEVKDVLSVMYEADPHSNAAGRGSIMERLMTVYKQNGQRRSQSYLSNEEDMIFKTKYKHDGFGLVTLEHILDPEENVIGRTYYLYDADLILTEVYVEDEERQMPRAASANAASTTTPTMSSVARCISMARTTMSSRRWSSTAKARRCRKSATNMTSTTSPSAPPFTTSTRTPTSPS